MSKAGLGWSNPQWGQTHAVKPVAWLHSLGPSAWWPLSCGLFVLTPTCCPSQRSSLIGWVQRDLLFWELLQIMHAPWALSLGQVATQGGTCIRRVRWTAARVGGLPTACLAPPPLPGFRCPEHHPGSAKLESESQAHRHHLEMWKKLWSRSQENWLWGLAVTLSSKNILGKQ